MPYLSFIKNLRPSCVVENKKLDLYLTDQRSREKHSALAVVEPKSTKQVSTILRYCYENNIKVVPQGGNTGLVNASIPKNNNDSLIISTKSLNRIIKIDKVSGLAIVESGVVLDNLNKSLSEYDLFYPLHIASSSRCTVGGVLATNAGGIEAIRYGTARNLCKGIEFVQADGSIISRTQTLFKNNSGYDISQLMIGSEGTLGIITSACLQLYPKKHKQFKAVIWTRDVFETMDIFLNMRKSCAGLLSCFEIMYCKTFTTLPCEMFEMKNLPKNANWVVYINVELPEIAIGWEKQIKNVLNNIDCKYDTNMDIVNSVYQVRMQHSKLQSSIGKAIKFDLAVPLDSFASFMTTALKMLSYDFPNLIPLPFGHCGDGNIHFDILIPKNMQNLLEIETKVITKIKNLVIANNGTLSAEHGIGRKNLKHLHMTRDSIDIQAMKNIRKTFDEKNILNSGVIF